MRQLKLQSKIMSGPDVSDWQTFLKGQGRLAGAVDGQFGPKSDAATRDYQAFSGLVADGIVGPDTLAQAVSDGYQSSTGANLFGVDASVDCSLFTARLAAAGMKFAARYYSDSAAKNLTPAEADLISQAGIGIVAVFQNRNNAAGLFSDASGDAQASKALQLAAAIGQPAGTAIYFAVDFDAAPAEAQGGITDFFVAVNSAFAAAATQYQVGVYGSGLTCRTIRDAGLATFTWLTGSTGYREYAAFRPEANIVQLAPERALFGGGLSVDDDIAQTADFGAFRTGMAVTQPA